MVEKGDHIRLRDIRLDYELNKTKIKSLPFNNISIWTVADNLNAILLSANKNGIDPEFDNIAPMPRTVTFGLTLNY
jgi:hypothetical protein